MGMLRTDELQRLDFETLVQTRKSVRQARSVTASCSPRDRGLGSVINGQGIMRSDIVREVANIPEDKVIMTCVAMGYPDDSFPANAVRSDREANSDFVRYVGFAD
jgi:hypothetical protein